MCGAVKGAAAHLAAVTTTAALGVAAPQLDPLEEAHSQTGSDAASTQTESSTPESLYDRKVCAVSNPSRVAPDHST